MTAPLGEDDFATGEQTACCTRDGPVRPLA